MAIIDLSKESMLCARCEDVYPIEEVQDDEIRFYKTPEGTLCELCYEDYQEEQECED